MGYSLAIRSGRLVNGSAFSFSVFAKLPETPGCKLASFVLHDLFR